MTEINNQPIEHTLALNDLNLTYFEWGSASDPTILLVHATGFHARCWDQVVAALPAGYHVVAVDMRGHGRSDKVPPYSWRAFGEDLESLVKHLNITDAIGVGHSMGGHCVTQSAADLPGVFKRLVLVDPVIFEPEAYKTNRYRGYDNAEDHPVARRRNKWRDWQEMYERFDGRGSFGLWQKQVLEDYCRYGVLPAADGDGFQLACPPVVEASVYLGNTETDVHNKLQDIDIPVAILRAPPRDPDAAVEMDFSKSPTWPELAKQFPNARDVYLPELTHFIVMQAPELVARFIVDENAEP